MLIVKLDSLCYKFVEVGNVGSTSHKFSTHRWLEALAIHAHESVVVLFNVRGVLLKLGCAVGCRPSLA